MRISYVSMFLTQANDGAVAVLVEEANLCYSIKNGTTLLFLPFKTKCNLEAETNKTVNHGSFVFCSKCLLLVIRTKLMEMLS